jgi:hypothetical protein
VLSARNWARRTQAIAGKLMIWFGDDVH